MLERRAPQALTSRKQQAAFALNSECAIPDCPHPRVITGKVCRFHGILWQELKQKAAKAHYAAKRLEEEKSA